MFCAKKTIITIYSTILLPELPSSGVLENPCCLWRVKELSDLIKNILICVTKMNKGLAGLERHEGVRNFIFV